MEKSNSKPLALVVGLCSHGLAMTRALNQCGVEVHAFDANPNLPGTQTNSATVHLVKNIKTESLVEDLVSFRKSVSADRQIVLFPTNDNNVKVIANHIQELSCYFLISWADCAASVLSLLLKSNIEQRCKEAGLLYPQSMVLTSIADVAVAKKQFEFPVIAKPVNPQSGFKALKCDTAQELEQLISKYEDDLPILLQHWITGTDVDLFFAALYLEKGKVLTRFIGNKLESFPPAMGQTTVAITSDNPEVLQLSEQFFDGLEMSGPVSLELKRDHLGRFWVIEPTIGRTDFWVGLCVAAKCNLLHTEYLHCLGRQPIADGPYTPTIWFDSERDVTAYARHVRKTLPWSKEKFSVSFSYLAKSDLKPFFRSFYQAIQKVTKSLVRRFDKKTVGTSVTGQSQYEVSTFTKLSLLPDSMKKLLQQNVEISIFCDYKWYENFCEHVADLNGEPRFYCLTDQSGQPLAILPLWLQHKRRFGIRVNYLTSLTNYYSPVFDLIFNEHLISKGRALEQLFLHLHSTSSEWDFMHVFPVDEFTKDEILSSSKKYHLNAESYCMTKNWFENIENGYQEYMDSIPSKTKNTIKRKVKKLDKNTDWEINIYQKPEDVAQALVDYHEVYNHSWKPVEPYPQFLNGLAYCAAEKGRLRLGVLSINKVAVAVQLWLVANNTAHIYKLAYRKEYKQYSPGSILTGHLVEHTLAEDQVNKIDFLTGKDDFKKDWMKSSRDLYGIQITNHKHFKSSIFELRNNLSLYKDKLLNRPHEK